MTTTVGYLASLLALFATLASCHQQDREAIRRKAIAIVAARPRKPIIPVPPACQPGDNERGVPNCDIDAAQRTGRAMEARERMAITALAFMTEWQKLRDPIAAGIVDDPTLVDRLIVPVARHWACPGYSGHTCQDDAAVPGVEAEIENALTATLADALGDATYREMSDGVWHAPGAFSELAKLNDPDCNALTGAAQDWRAQRIRTYVLAALSAKPGSDH